MTLTQPAWLALALLVGVLWWLHRRLAQPRVVRVPSLLPYRTEGVEPPTAAATRRIDVTFWCLAGAIVLLALAAAGPRLAPAAVPGVYVVIDRSPSTAGVRAQLVERAQVLLGEVAAGVRVHVELLDGAPVVDGPSVGLAELAADASNAAEDGLPASILPHVVAAAAAGYPGVLLLSERSAGLPDGVVALGPAEPPAPNVACLGAALDGDRLLVSYTLRAPSGQDITQSLTGEVVAEREGQQSEPGRSNPRRPEVQPLEVRVGSVATAALTAPEPGERIAVRFQLPGGGRADTLPADDSVRVRRRSWSDRFAWRGPDAPLLRAALEVCGLATAEPGEAVDLQVCVADAEALDAVPLLRWLPQTGPPRTPIVWIAAEPDLVSGGTLRGEGDLVPLLPAPASTIAARGRLRGGIPALADSNGALVAATVDEVVCVLDPDDPLSTWHRDPSFPVFVASVVEHLRGRSPLTVDGLVPRAEQVPHGAAPATPTLDQVRALLRPDEPGEQRDLGGWAAGAAALLVGVGTVLLARRRA